MECIALVLQVGQAFCVTTSTKAVLPTTIAIMVENASQDCWICMEMINYFATAPTRLKLMAPSMLESIAKLPLTRFVMMMVLSSVSMEGIAISTIRKYQLSLFLIACFFHSVLTIFYILYNSNDCRDKDAEPCLCEPGWEGFHCEFKTGQVPECTLGCQNDGVCVVGVLSAKEASQHHSIWGSSQEINDHMRCLCPPGFGGPTCESVSQCDLEDSHQCLHGGTCVTTQVTSQETGLVETEYHCDCTTAANGQDRHTGQFCQFQSETYCSDVDVNLWCTNGGKCDEEDPTNGCICPEGFAGFKCEYPQTAKEDKPSNNDDDDHLDFELCGGNVCHNGGSCTTTVVTTSNGGKLEQEHCDCSTAIRETDMANATVYAGDSCQFEASVFCTLPQDGMPLSSSMFCVNGGLCRDHVLQGCDCPTGWTGFHCEYPEETIELTDSTDDDLEDAVECGGRYCYNGGVCEEFQEINDNGEYATIRECDCASATTDTELFAGDQCQYRSTELCTEPEDGEAHKGQRFCVNHGACREDPLDDCDCPAGWKGSMCQFPVEDDSYADQGEECGDRYCYNGGSCVTTKVTRKSETTTEYYCDCANAFDDSNLYGKTPEGARLI